MNSSTVSATITRPATGVAVVHVHEAALGLSVKQGLRTVLNQQLADGITHIVMDLSEVSFCDSTGLSVLVYAHRQATARNGSVRLVGVSGQPERVLELSNLDWLLRRFPTVEAAMEAD